MPQVVFNGDFFEEDEVSISINNRSFRYGDGCFETMKIIHGDIVSAPLHFNRLFSSLAVLQFSNAGFTSAYLHQLILKLVQINKHENLARVRLTIFRDDSGLYDDINHQPNFIIQSWAANTESNHFNKQGLQLNIFREAKKTCDGFSLIKSNNYLPYVMGALYAKKNRLNDCIILNCFNRVAEATIANIFIITNGVIKTPALTEGCVSGVMRRHLINALTKHDYPFKEGEISTEELLSASEVFLTNAQYGIRWVEKIGDSNFSNEMSSLLHQKFIEPLFTSATF